MGREAMVRCQRDRLQPELAGRAVASGMYVHRLVTVEAVEEEAEWPGDVVNRWHWSTKGKIVVAYADRRVNLGRPPLLRKVVLP